MALSAEEKAKLRELATANGDDPDEIVSEVEAALGGGDDEEPKPPGKPGEPAPQAGAESAVKAHGGRGYFAYEYPFLTVNEVRASLFLGPAPDGELYTNEWLAKRGGGTTPPAQEIPPNE